jgi:hypothetical protein
MGFVLTNYQNCTSCVYLNSTVNGNNIKFILEKAMKAQMGSRDITLLFPEPLSWLGVCGQRHAPGRFTPGKDPVPILYT